MQAEMKSAERAVKIDRALMPVAILIGFLALAHVFVLMLMGQGYDYALGFIPMFDLEKEYNVPTFVSAVLLVLVAISCLAQNAADAAPLSDRRWWTAGFVGFVYLAADELFRLHERLAPAVISITDALNLPVTHIAWVLGGIVLLVPVSMIAYSFVRRQRVELRKELLIAAAVFLGAAVGFELLESAWKGSGGSQLGYMLLVLVEEPMEMAGSALAVRALLRNLARSDAMIRFVI